MVPGIFRLRLMYMVAMILPALNMNAQPKRDTSYVNALIRKGAQLTDKKETTKAELKTTLSLANQAETISREIDYKKGVGNAYLIMAEAYRELGDQTNARRFSQKALDILAQYGNQIEKAKAMVEVGGAMDNGTELGQKINYYKQGADLFHQAGDKKAESVIREFLGDLYIRADLYPQALQSLDAAQRLYKQIGFKRLHGLYSLYGEIYYDQGNLSESLKYNLMAAQTGEKLGDTGPLMVTIYNRLGISYVSSDYNSQAIEYFAKGLSIAKARKDSSAIQLLQKNMADAMRRKGDYVQGLKLLKQTARDYPFTDEAHRLHAWFVFMKLYMALGDTKGARPYYGQLLNYYKGPKVTPTEKIAIEVLFAEYFQNQGRYAQAAVYLDAARVSKQTLPFTLEKVMMYEWLAFRADSAAGRDEASIEHYKNFKHASDSSYNVSKARQFDQLRLQFETEKKDQDIELLTQNSKLQQALIQREKLLRNVFITGVVVLLLFSALLYNRYRLKARTNSELEQNRQQINESNLALKQLLEEKEWLLKEIHHRVKNNLQIVISLLNTQSEYLQNDDAIAAIKNSQHRMYAMSLIHQRLYQADNLGKIDMKAYITELISYMRDSFETDSKIRFELDCDQVSLDVVQAVPVGLILNEAVSNTIKYAFPGQRSGSVAISFKTSPDCQCDLKVADNGVGFRIAEDNSENESLGMSLMRGLADQLEGDFEAISSSEGVLISVLFQCRDFMVPHKTKEMTI